VASGSPRNFSLSCRSLSHPGVAVLVVVLVLVLVLVAAMLGTCALAAARSIAALGLMAAWIAC
jgi:hypothetical protein